MRPLVTIIGHNEKETDRIYEYLKSLEDHRWFRGLRPQGLTILGFPIEGMYLPATTKGLTLLNVEDDRSLKLELEDLGFRFDIIELALIREEDVHSPMGKYLGTSQEYVLIDNDEMVGDFLLLSFDDQTSMIEDDMRKLLNELVESRILSIETGLGARYYDPLFENYE